MWRWLFVAAFVFFVFAAVRWFIRGAAEQQGPRLSSAAVVDCKLCGATLNAKDAVFVPGSRNEWVCRGACKTTTRS